MLQTFLSKNSVPLIIMQRYSLSEACFLLASCRNVLILHLMYVISVQSCLQSFKAITAGAFA